MHKIISTVILIFRKYFFFVHACNVNYTFKSLYIPNVSRTLSSMWLKETAKYLYSKLNCYTRLDSVGEAG